MQSDQVSQYEYKMSEKLSKLNFKNHYMVIILAFIWIPPMVNFWISIGEIFTIHLTNDIPSEVEKYYDKETFEISKIQTLYRLDLEQQYESLYFAVLKTIVIVAGLVPLLWQCSVSIARRLQVFWELYVTLIMVSLLVILNTLLRIPFVFLVWLLGSQNFFNAFLWILMDGMIWFVLALLYSCFVFFGVTLFKRFIFLYMAVVVIVTLLVSSCAKDAVTPHEELNDPELATMIHKFTIEKQLPTYQIFITRGGDFRTGITGFTGLVGNRRVYVDERLLKCTACNQDETSCTNALVNCSTVDSGLSYFKRKFTDEEILAFVANQIGHRKYFHVLIDSFVILLSIVGIFGLCGYLYGNDQLHELFGLYEDCSRVLKAIVVYVFVIEPLLDDVLVPMLKIIERSQEYDADVFTANLGIKEDLISCLGKMYSVSQQFPTHYRMYSLLKCSVPSLMERMTALN